MYTKRNSSEPPSTASQCCMPCSLIEPLQLLGFHSPNLSLQHQFMVQVGQHASHEQGTACLPKGYPGTTQPRFQTAPTLTACVQSRTSAPFTEAVRCLAPRSRHLTYMTGATDEAVEVHAMWSEFGCGPDARRTSTGPIPGPEFSRWFGIQDA